MAEQRDIDRAVKRLREEMVAYVDAKIAAIPTPEMAAPEVDLSHVHERIGEAEEAAKAAAGKASGAKAAADTVAATHESHKAWLAAVPNLIEASADKLRGIVHEMGETVRNEAGHARGELADKIGALEDRAKSALATLSGDVSARIEGIERRLQSSFSTLSGDVKARLQELESEIEALKKPKPKPRAKK